MAIVNGDLIGDIICCSLNGISKDGKTLPDDTYFYIIKLLDFSDEYSGYIVIKR